MTVREQIHAAIQTALETIPDVEVEPDLSMEPPAPSLSIIDQGETKLTQTTYSTRWLMRVGIYGLTEGNGGAAARLARNTLIGQVRDALTVDPQFGGLVSSSELGDLKTEVLPNLEVRTSDFMQILELNYAVRTTNSQSSSD